MKRKKWSEAEEQTLLSKYADLQSSGTLAKLKTREKKFRPIADQVNSLHHNSDPTTYPFKWSWRDVSIKVQNMRHQYLGVKLKIRISDHEFNWPDAPNHWENFPKYKQVFGDIELDPKSKSALLDSENDILEGFEDCNGNPNYSNNSNKECEENCGIWDWRLELENEMDMERKRRIKLEEKRDLEEMEWREKMVNLQMEHERQMMQMHADACQNQMQILGVMARLICQIFGSSDGLESLPNQSLGDEVKRSANSPPDFM